MDLQLDWIKCGTKDPKVWCSLLGVDLDDAHFNGMEGVYIIWHSGDGPNVVYVGQGAIRDRLAEHREDPEVLAYESQILYATWGSVAKAHRDGVERYLANQLPPKVGRRFPDVPAISVNLPA